MAPGQRPGPQTWFSHNRLAASLDIVPPEPAIGVAGWTGLASTLQTLWMVSGKDASGAPGDGVSPGGAWMSISKGM